MTYLTRLFAETGLRRPGQTDVAPVLPDRTGGIPPPIFEIDEIREDTPAAFAPPTSPAATPSNAPPIVPSIPPATPPVPLLSAPAPEPARAKAPAPHDAPALSRPSPLDAAPDAAPSPASAAVPPPLVTPEQPMLATLTPNALAPAAPVRPPQDVAANSPLAHDRTPAASVAPSAPPPPGSSPTLAAVRAWVAAGPSPEERHDRVAPVQMPPSAPEIVAGSDQAAGVARPQERAVDAATPWRGDPAVAQQTLSIGTIELTIEAPPPVIPDAPPRTPPARSPAPPPDGAVQRLRRHYVSWWGGS